MYIPECRNGFDVTFDLIGNLTNAGERLVMSRGYKFVMAAGEQRFKEVWAALQDIFEGYTAALAS